MNIAKINECSDVYKMFCMDSARIKNEDGVITKKFMKNGPKKSLKIQNGPKKTNY